MGPGFADSKRPWNRAEWWIVDPQGHIRMRFQGCLRSEAIQCAALFWKEPAENLRAVSWLELEPAQRLTCRDLRPMTLARAGERLGNVQLINAEERAKIRGKR
jgi:hypothetical protein